MTKRRKFLITSFILSLGFVGIQFLDNPYKIYAIFVLSLITSILFLWSLWEGIGKNSTLLTLILPTFFTGGVGVFWFLLPSNVFARLPMIIFYGLGIYALSLTMNVFTVSAVRTIALLRAARGVGFVLTLITLFLIYNAILSLKIPLWGSSLLITTLSFLLFLQGFWTIPLDKKITKDLLNISLVSSLVVGEIAVSLFFWPATLVVGSIFLTVAVYVLLGLGQAKLEQRLFPQTVKEYLLVGILVFIGMFLLHTGEI
ncbi:MAG: hypothetical protein NTV24_04105 [Candidatus Woesebacteria bacterium]|nr:hypothetical protein [Candidatus Woesebacteria bacterium]